MAAPWQLLYVRLAWLSSSRRCLSSAASPSSAAIRRTFLRYFEERHGHRHVPSSAPSHPLFTCGPLLVDHYSGRGLYEGLFCWGHRSDPLVSVFVFFREADQSLRLLPQHHVDTGMGLERLVTVLQGKSSNYSTDLFTPILEEIERGSKAPPYGGRLGREDTNHVDMAYRVVADHIRTLSVCIADGVYPGMAGAELVLRHILRRAVRFSSEILRAPPRLLSSLVPTVVQILFTHCALFRPTVDVAWSLLRNLGFPLDLIGLILEERGFSLDRTALEELIEEEEKRKLRNQQAEGPVAGLDLDVHSLAELHRRGIPTTDDSPKYSYTLGDDGKYGKSGCNTTGRGITVPGHGGRGGVPYGLDIDCDVLFPVDSLHLAGGYVLHEVIATEPLRVGDRLVLFLDEAQRTSCMEKHTATHLLNFALRHVLGENTAQRGSHVTADRLRFDVSVTGLVNSQQLQEVEKILRNLIGQNQKVYTAEVPLTDAKNISGLRSVDEVYPDPVRVVSVGVPIQEVLRADSRAAQHTSVELCCGTHLLETGSIEDLVIISEKPLMKGIIRLIAVTGEGAREAQEVGQALQREVESMAERMKMMTLPSLTEAQRLSKEVGLVTDSVDSARMPQWQRKELQVTLKSLQRSANTAVRKAIGRKVKERGAGQSYMRGNKDTGRGGAGQSHIPHVICNLPYWLLVSETRMLKFVMEESQSTTNFCFSNIRIRLLPLPVWVHYIPQNKTFPLHLLFVILEDIQGATEVRDLGVPRTRGEFRIPAHMTSSSPQRPSSSLSALDWAVNVCTAMGGKAGGSNGSANGNGSCEDLASIVEVALKYAQTKICDTEHESRGAGEN
ncbi:alanine--tRNA ligase, mitochondrial-like [Pyxicephalus adspersus]|uniref:alanine--tRNA ligase, mitochondrial-like n=1 Tax=Pyxicephalus adspersus TaxID=30357 RepID=UPI003B5C44E9